MLVNVIGFVDVVNGGTVEELSVGALEICHASYEIDCSWLQESKLIVNLLTLEQIF